MEIQQIRIAAPGVRSLVWDGDALVDWVDGGQCWWLNGERVGRAVRYAYPFDGAVSLPGSDVAVIYTRFGTKALVLQAGNVVREINRSFYHADAYEYPIALLPLPSGRVGLAHCPDAYCQLDIEDALTGERLTCAIGRKPADKFHSRLKASADGRFLVSAGWLWHPVEDISVYDVGWALRDAAHFDGPGVGINAWADESSATFTAAGELLVALKGDIDSEDSATQRGEVRRYDLTRPDPSVVTTELGRLGTIEPVGEHHVLALYEHPRLIDLRTGAEVASWPSLNSGTQFSSICDAGRIPPMAFDALNQRFAVADSTGITVLWFRS